MIRIISIDERCGRVEEQKDGIRFELAIGTMTGEPDTITAGLNEVIGSYLSEDVPHHVTLSNTSMLLVNTFYLRRTTIEPVYTAIKEAVTNYLSQFPQY